MKEKACKIHNTSVNVYRACVYLLRTGITKPVRVYFWPDMVSHTWNRTVYVSDVINLSKQAFLKASNSSKSLPSSLSETEKGTHSTS